MKPAKLTMGFVVMAIFSSDLYALDRSIVKIIPITKSECAYAEPGKSLETHSDCLELLGNNQFKIRPEHLKKMDFSYANGLAALYYQGGTAYVSPKGKIARTFTFDNGPDYFVDGLAHVVLDLMEKWVSLITS